MLGYAIKNLHFHYRMLLPIGQGTYGSVRLAQHKLTGTLVAIKTIANSKRRLHWILSEIAILETLEHPNIIRLFQVLETPKCYHLVMEYAPGGNLFQLVREEGRLEEEKARKIFGQIVAAIKHCHSMDIIHRDLKPQNILIDEDGAVKVIDFGLATRSRAGTKLKGQCGTKGFFAPELVHDIAYDGRKADIWSLGVLLFFITTGHLPFSSKQWCETAKKITTATYDIPTYLSGQLENLIHQMLTVAPEMRPSIEELEKHPWVIKLEPTVHDSYSDSTIIDTLCDAGFDATKIRRSLQEKTYDATMAAYLILKEQARKGLKLGGTTSAKPVNPGATPPSTPVHASISGLPLKHIASTPNFGLFHAHPSRQPLPVARTLPGQKVTRSASLPAIALCCSQKNTPTCSHAAAARAVAAPRVFGSILGEEAPLPQGQDSDTETASPPQNIGCFQKLRRRIVDCLTKLCCFPRIPRTKPWRPVFTHKVGPMKEAGGGAQ
ncbi:putative sperm motility kinase W [Acomys russatus]|uniref:putative sperm motility kinase W n=1 Tax=Acomys russatus TaxID=60746 RepID=UPI0021E27975|nr:putative sperm motility kinase W [Acomys russatus]